MSSAAPRLRRLLGALVVALALVSASACSSAVDELRKSSSEPQDGGVIRVGAAQDIVPPSIFTNSSDAANVLIGNVYDSLVDYPLDSLDPKPRLATSWTSNADGTQLTLQLRDDVKFHDGRDFTSKDVEFSIKTWADPKWTVQLQRTAAAVTGFDTSDPHAITLTFAHPLSNIFDLLDLLPIIDSASIDQVRTGEAFVGTGPFTFSSWTPGSKLSFQRNDDYWGAKAHLDGIEVDIIPDPQAQVSQLRSGQLDLILAGTKRDLESLGKDDAYDVRQWKGADVQTYVGANVENPALSDVRLRKAVAHALDRDRIVEEVYRGTGVAANLPWSETSPAYDEKANHTYDYDLDRARSLVEEVIDEKGALPTIPLTYSAGDPDYDAIAQIIQADLKQIGVEVRLDPIEQADVIKRLIGAKFDGLWILQHSYAQYTPSTLSVSAYPFNAEHNASRYVNADYARHADAAWKKKPEEVAAADYAALNKDLLDGAFLLELAVRFPQTASTAKVHDLDLSKRAEPQLAGAHLG